MKQWEDRFIKREMIPAGELAKRFNIKNHRLHPEEQSAAVEASLDKLGWIDEVSLSTNGDGPASLTENPDAIMTDGHDRVEITLLRFGPDEPVPTNWYRLTPAQTDAAIKYKDATAAMAGIDWPKWEALELEADFQIPEIDLFMEELDLGGEEKPKNNQGSGGGNLSDRFVVPPFSVLDARQGYWQERKRAWLALGIQSELGRGENLQGLSPANYEYMYNRAEYLSKKPNATPGGSPLPAATLGKDGKTVRGDGRGRPLNSGGGGKDGDAQRSNAKKKKVRYARTFGQDLMRGEHTVGEKD